MKATYVAVHGIAQYARTFLKNEIKDKLVGIHLDETSYGKTRIELWVVYYADGVRKNRYLRTMELNVKVNTDFFCVYEFTKVIKFAEGFSAFVSSSLKARSLLQPMCLALDVTGERSTVVHIFCQFSSCYKEFWISSKLLKSWYLCLTSSI